MANAAAPDPARRLAWLYRLALSAIGVLALLGQLAIRADLTRQANDSKVINLSGRQRMLSQRLTKQILLLAQSPPPGAEQVQEVRVTLKELERQHRILSEQVAPPFNKAPNSPTTQHLFAELTPHQQTIARIGQELLGQPLVALPQWVALRLPELRRAEQNFLAGMEEITHQYELEASARVQGLKQLEGWLFLITIVVLLMEALLVFRPAVAKIRHYFEALQATNRQLRATAADLHTSRQQWLRANLEAQELERQRIAMDLHDDLGPLLALVRMKLELLQPQLVDAEPLEQAQHHLEQIQQGLRNILQELRPPALEALGLTTALERLLEDSQPQGDPQIKGYLNLAGQVLPASFETHVYRMVAELLHNALQHSGASEIVVQVFVLEENLVIMVEDDGVGLPEPAKWSQYSGRGLKNIQSRVEALGGHLQVDTGVPAGTTFSVYLPWPADLLKKKEK